MVTVRLVHRAEIDSNWHTPFTGSDDELHWLSSDRTVGDLQGTYGADLVCELMPLGGNALLGASFSTVDQSPQTFAHEIGHNFGCHHNIEVEGSRGTPSYAYGYYVTVGGIQQGDAMSYTSGILPFFSNPDLSWDGYPLGNASLADNHRNINEQRASVAAWQSAKIAALASPSFPTSSSFAFDLTGPSSTSGTYSVEYTSDYQTWATLTGYSSFSFSGGSPLTITDSTVTGTTAQRYYRVKKGSAIVGAQVGFYRVNSPTGYSMLGNHLDSSDNRIPNVITAPPDGLQLQKWNDQSWTVVSYHSLFGGWTDSNTSFGLGEGLLIWCPAPTQFTFVGFVREGFEINLGHQWRIVASGAPQGGLLSSTLQFPVLPFLDKVDRMTSSNVYTEYTSDGSAWSPTEPTVNLGEAFWTYRANYNATDLDHDFWKRVFWTWP
jgi:hypothetical protein